METSSERQRGGAARTVPERVRRDESGAVVITWSDGRVCTYPAGLLRRNCPCAACRADAAARGTGYIPLFTRDALTVSAITQAGAYALQFRWGDGHHTGLYDFAYLRGLCPDAPPPSAP